MIRKSLAKSVRVEKHLALAAIYFYLGYYSGMRYSFNSMKPLNPNPRGEPEYIHSMIEILPSEVAALRLGADPEPAALRINQLLNEKKRRSRRH